MTGIENEESRKGNIIVRGEIEIFLLKIASLLLSFQLLSQSWTASI